MACFWGGIQNAAICENNRKWADMLSESGYWYWVLFRGSACVVMTVPWTCTVNSNLGEYQNWTPCYGTISHDKMMSFGTVVRTVCTCSDAVHMFSSWVLIHPEIKILLLEDYVSCIWFFVGKPLQSLPLPILIWPELQKDRRNQTAASVCRCSSMNSEQQLKQTHSRWTCCDSCRWVRMLFMVFLFLFMVF